MRTVYHVVGYTQFYGTCKMHLFRDCGLLIKRNRDAHLSWGTRKGVSPPIETVEGYEGRNLCKICLKREARQ